MFFVIVEETIPKVSPRHDVVAVAIRVRHGVSSLPGSAQ